METFRIDILNPKALSLLQNLADLNLIKISKDKKKTEFLELIGELRTKSNQAITLDEITKEVEEVRKARYDQ